MTSEIKVGDYAHTIKGARFWGKVVSVYELPQLVEGQQSGGEWRADILAVDGGFLGTLHVYPLAQLAPGIPDYPTYDTANLQAEIERLKAREAELVDVLGLFDTWWEMRADRGDKNGSRGRAFAAFDAAKDAARKAIEGE